MTKLRRDIRVALLGAASGLFSISLFLLVARVDAYYAYLTWINENRYSTYPPAVENLWWIPISVWHIVLSVVASLLVHRYLAASQRSPFLLWQAVGVVVLLGWGLSFDVLFGIDALMTGRLKNPLRRELGFEEMEFIAKYVASIFAGNVLYGSVMQSCAQQYRSHRA